MAERLKVIHMCRRGIVGGIAVGESGPTEEQIFQAQLLVDECNNSEPSFITKEENTKFVGRCPEDCELFKLACKLPWYDGSSRED